MAKKEKEAKKVLERVYNVPLRREWLKVARWKRTKKAVKAFKEFIAKHMKSDNVKIGEYANLEMWKHGIKNPPHHLKVNCIKFDDGKVIAELFGKPIEELKEEKKKAKKGEAKGKEEMSETPRVSEHAQKSKISDKPKGEVKEKEEELEKKIEEVKEEEAEEAKEIEKEEIKELKKEHPKVHAPKAPPKPRMQEAHPTAPRSV